MNRFISIGVLVLGLAGVAGAQQVGSQAQLDQILSGGYEYTDAFLGYNVAGGSADVMNSSFLNVNSVINGQGPGLVDPGVTYSTQNSGSTLQWNGVNYYGSTNQEILSNDQELQINYTMAVDAMGFQVRAYAGYGDNFTANVYNGSTLVGTYSGTLANDGSSQFFGWENATGITSVDLFATNQPWSPIIAEHSYGDAPISPEPASFAILGLGGLALLRRRRRA